MQRWAAALAFALAVAFAAAAVSVRGGGLGSLSGWLQVGDARWRAGEGELRVDAGGSDTMLVTRAEHRDFVLSFRFWIDGDANSGVFIRCTDPVEISPFSCYEINIWDDHPRQEWRTGAIVGHVAPPLARVESVGRWNTARIVADGPLVHVVMNGETTAVLRDAEPRSGFIALQRFGSGAVRFRDVVVADPTNAEER